MRPSTLQQRRIARAVLATLTATGLSFGTAAPVASSTQENDVRWAKIGTAEIQEQRITNASQYTGSATNVVIMISDDQPKGTMDAMPNVRSEIADLGVQMNNGITPTALCCPSRTALLTGDHSHTTGVYINHGTNGGWKAFFGKGKGAERRTLATHLDRLGYRTGLFGKYVNGFSRSRPKGYIPPGWDKFGAFDADGRGDRAYYDYKLIGNVGNPHYGSSPSDYSTDVTADYAVKFIANAGTEVPVFLYWAPYGPHSPITPAPRDKGTWPLEPASAIGALNEDDVSDKPKWIAKRSRVSALRMRRELTEQHEALMSVDDGVGQIIQALDETNRLSNTIIVYMSDNGYMLGAHRLVKKDLPHRRSSEVPMYVRWDEHIRAGSSSDRVTPQVDLTAAIARATGITRWSMEGRSFLSASRLGTVLEQMKFSGHPAYCGYRTARYVFIQYSAGHGRELYDYNTDPDELENLVSKGRYDAIQTNLKSRAKKACRPTPPGFSWS